MPTSLSQLYREHRKTTIIAGIFVLLLAVYLWNGQRTPAPKYITAPVKRGDITAIVQATGTINPLTTVPVGSYVSGTVQYIFADFNTRVSAGQVLAQLDPAIYEAAVINARGNVANAKASLDNLQASIDSARANVVNDQANVRKAQADLDYARVSGKRTADLALAGVLSTDNNDLAQSTLGQKQAALQSAIAQVNQAKAQVEQTIAQVEQARAQIVSNEGLLKQAVTNLEYTTILSPIDGTVVARNIDVGQSVAASLQAPNVFTIAQDLKHMEVLTKTDESDTGSVHVGTGVTFQVDAFPTLQFRGRVSAIRLNAYTVQNVVTYDTVIDFENPDEKLLPGETAYVTIPTGHATNAILVPNASLTFTPPLTRPQLQALYKQYNIRPEAYTTHLGGWQVVWRPGPDKKPVPLAIQVGITDYASMQVLDGNLHEGDLLITGEMQAKSSSSGPPGIGPRR